MAISPINRIIEIYKRLPPDIRMSFLKDRLQHLNGRQVADLYHSISENESYVLEFKKETIANLSELINASILSPEEKETISGIIRKLLLFPTWEQRFPVLKFFLDLHTNEPEKILEFVCTIVDSPFSFNEPESMLVVDYFFNRASDDVDKVCKLIARFEQQYVGNLRVKEYLESFKEELSIKGINSKFIGSEIRQLYFSQFILGSLINEDLLILGRSGSGKSTLAKILHMNGRLRARDYKEFTCDKEEERKNLISESLNGDNRECTFFIDEIHALGADNQRLLVNHYKDAGIRVICASSLSLPEVEALSFNDFIRRYCCHVFRIPDIHERKVDLRELILNTIRAKSMSIDNDVLDGLVINHEWPYNADEVIKVINEVCNALYPDCATISCDSVIKCLTRLPARSLLILKKIPGISKKLDG